MKRLLVAAVRFACLVAAVVATPAFAGENALEWVNRLRLAAGAPGLQSDDLLSRTARDWARKLAEAGAIEEAWEASPSHRQLALRRHWTHVGVGESPGARGGEVCVMLFCARLVENLEISVDESELHVNGRLTTSRASATIIVAGLEAHRPETWDAASRCFAFT